VHRQFLILILLFYSISGKHSLAQDKEVYYIVKDLKADWLVLDHKSSMLVPYLPSVNSKSQVVHFDLNIRLYQDSYIQIAYVPETGFFINNTLVDYSDHKKVRIYSIDSLTSYFPGSRFFVSLYSNGFISNINTRIVTPHEGIAVSSEDAMFLPIQAVRYSKGMELAKVAVILIFALYAFYLNNNRRAFIDYYNISNTFLRVSVDEFLDRTANITRVDIGFIIGLSVVMSFITLMILKNQEIQPGPAEAGSVFGFILIWVILMIVLFFWYLIRIFIISIMSDIFQIREVKVIHTFELIRLNNFFSLMFFIVVIAFLFVMKMTPDNLGRLLANLLLVVAFIRISVLFIKFLNSTTYKKLYLFAYLCVAEVFPVLIGLKILLKSSFLSNMI
jgi:hypothetical protein